MHRTICANALNDGFAIESDRPRVRARNAVEVDAVGQTLERILFEGLELGELDLGVLRDLLTRQPRLLSRLAKFISDGHKRKRLPKACQHREGAVLGVPVISESVVLGPLTRILVLASVRASGYGPVTDTDGWR
jgi:hypothetical protein